MGTQRPRPAIIVLEDREDGTLWQLHHSAVLSLVGITDAALSVFRAAEVRAYHAGEEPVLGTNPTLRLIVRGGRLGYEMSPLPRAISDRDNAPILTRLATSDARLWFEINRGDDSRHWLAPGDTLGYAEFEE